MSNAKNLAGSPSLFTLVIAAIAICGTAAAVLLAPAEATSRTPVTAAYAGPSDYFPAQYTNQAVEIEPMPEMYY